MHVQGRAVLIPYTLSMCTCIGGLLDSICKSFGQSRLIVGYSQPQTVGYNLLRRIEYTFSACYAEIHPNYTDYKFIC